MMTVSLHHVDGREFARAFGLTSRSSWIVDCILAEFGCREDDVGFVDDDMVTVDGLPVASVIVS